MKVTTRWRPAPATVIACLALAIALSGTSYAAFVLPANSVGSKQLKRNAVLSSKIKDGSLLRSDFKQGQLPRGAPGALGATGPQGPPGPKGDTGSVDTSNFYDKAASDSHFLGIAATAANAANLGGAPAAHYVNGAKGGTLFQDVRTLQVDGPLAVIALPGHALMHLQLACAAPPGMAAIPSVALVNSGEAPFDLFYTNDNSAPIHTSVQAPATALLSTGLITTYGSFSNGDTLDAKVASYGDVDGCHFISEGTIAKGS
jgi:hypothetical protein